MANIFDKRGITPPTDSGAEIFETLLSAPGVRIERILSFGAGEGEWYDQSWDEWVMVARGEAEIEWADGTTVCLTAGDYLRIEANRRHRVLCTSYDCIWLAVHLTS